MAIFYVNTGFASTNLWRQAILWDHGGAIRAGFAMTLMTGLAEFRLDFQSPVILILIVITGQRRRRHA